MSYSKGNSNILKPEPYIHMFWCVNQSYLPKSLWIRPLDCLSWQLRYICSSLLWGNCVAEVVIFVTDTLRLLFWCLDNWKDSLHRLTFMLNNKTLFVTRYTGLGSSRSLALGELLQFNDQPSRLLVGSSSRSTHSHSYLVKFGPSTSNYDALPTYITSDLYMKGSASNNTQ